MKSSVEKLSDTRVKLTVEVPFEELNKEVDQAYAAIAQQVSIPGFRRGKAPRQLIDARFGRGPILEQVVNDMLPSRYQAACEENELPVLGQPKIDITKIDDGKLVEFVAEVDVRPEIEVPDFSSYEVTVPKAEVNSEKVDAEVDKLRARFSELKDTDRELKDGDVASIDLSATIDGKEIEEAKTEGLTYNVGSGDLIEGLDEALLGLKTGDEKEFTATLEHPDYKDQEATITVVVKQTKEAELPDFDEEFVQMASEFDEPNELIGDITTRLEEEAKSAQAAAIRDEVLKKALSEVDFSLPETVVDEQVDAQKHQLLGQLAHDEAALNRILEAQGTTREEFDKDIRENATEAVRTQLFLDALAEKENPEVSQQELTDHILFTADSYGMDPNQFIQQLQQSNQIGNLFADVRRGKALAVAICQVTVKDEDGEDVDPKQYFGDEDEIAEAEKKIDDAKAEKADADKADKADEAKAEKADDAKAETEEKEEN